VGALALLPEKELDAIWGQLTDDVSSALTLAWPA